MHRDKRQTVEQETENMNKLNHFKCYFYNTKSQQQPPQGVLNWHDNNTEQPQQSDKTPF